MYLIERLPYCKDVFLKPAYRISPFQTSDIAINYGLRDDGNGKRFLQNHLRDASYVFTLSGRQALELSLSEFQLKKSDIVTILTSSNNYYISGCVTKTIEKFCSWSRKIETNTRVILINHEFGIPYPDLDGISKIGIPVIEDRAHCFLSQNPQDNVGFVGDYVIYSLPKIFPVQLGGILQSNFNAPLPQDQNDDLADYLLGVICHQAKRIDQIVDLRRRNHRILERLFSAKGVVARWSLEEKIVPGVCMLKLPGWVNKERLKKHYQEYGVESSIFYGEDAFFIPVHQRLQEVDLFYFLGLYELFLEASNDI